MNKGTTVLLRCIISIIAIGVLAGMIRFPQTEGRAANLDLISIYSDPFIIYIYIASIPFFWSLYQAFKLLRFIEAKKVSSKGALATLNNIKYASLSLIGLIAGAIVFIRFFAHGDDPAGPTMLGISTAFALGIVATAADIFQKRFQNKI